MKNLWFYKFILVSLFIVTLSGCKIVMEYHMDDCDPTTTIIDSSGTKNDAVLKHGAGNTDGLSAQFSFDSSSDDGYVVCANRWFRGQGYSVSGDPWYYTAQYYTEAPDHDDISPLASRSKAMTLTGWFKTSSSNGTIIAKAGGASNSREYRVFLEGGNLKVTLWNQYGSQETFTIASSVADNAWHAFAITAEISWNNSLKVKKYLDGAYKGNDTRRNFHYCTNTNGSLFIGAMNWGNGNITDYFAGYIDELIMTDDIQSQNALRNSYLNMKGHKDREGNSRTCSCSISPIADYHFDECSWDGTSGEVVDSSGNNNHGTAVYDATTTPRAGSGGVCRAGVFDGSGDYVEIPDAPELNPAGAFSASVWFRANSLNWTGLVTKLTNVNPGDGRGWNLQVGDILGKTPEKIASIMADANGRFDYIKSTTVPQVGVWYHVVLVHQADNLNRLYVNGRQEATKSHEIAFTSNPFQIGKFYTDVNHLVFDGTIDEVELYDEALDHDQVQTLYTNQLAQKNCNGSPRECAQCFKIDHFEFVHDGQGLTCQAESVVLKACANIDCSTEYAYPVTITLTPATANPPTWIGGDTQTFTGHQVFQLRQTQRGTLSLGLTNPDHTPANGYRCYDSGIEGDCDIEFHDSGFIFNVSDLTSCQTSPTVSIQAVRTDNTTQTCVADAGFAGTTKTVNFWSTYVNPATGTNSVSLSGTNLATSSPGTGVPLNFDATATANFTVSYPDAGQMQLDARYDGIGSEEAGLVMLGADSFIVRPVGLCVYSDDANADCLAGNDTCSVFKRVDEDFNLRVKGVCWESAGDTDYCSGNATTSNFQLNNIPVSHNLVAPTGSGISAGSIGVNSINVTAADNGEHVVPNQHVSEVGVFTFTVTPPDYFGGALPVATSANIGRFIPDHFVASVIDNGVLEDACSGFTYSGQPFTYASTNYPELLITAVDTGGNTTVNYRDGFVKLTQPTQINMPAVTADATHFGALGTPLALTWNPATSMLVANNDGTLNFKLGADEFIYSREANALVAPFTSAIELNITAITDSDGVAATGLPVTFSPTGTAIRYGQLQLQNSYGPETLDLGVPVLTEYHNGSGFLPNVLDSCTSYDASYLSLNNYQGNLNSGETVASGHGSLLSGTGSSLSLSAPGIGNDGSVDLLYDLDTAGLGWLKPNGNNPTAKATFGIFKGNEHIIYLRETY